MAGTASARIPFDGKKGNASMSFRAIASVAAAAVLATTPAFARSGRSHHVHHRASLAYRAAPFEGSAPGYGGGYVPRAYGGYYGTNGWEAANNARLTAQAYREPGLTLELALRSTYRHARSIGEHTYREKKKKKKEASRRHGPSPVDTKQGTWT